MPPSRRGAAMRCETGLERSAPRGCLCRRRCPASDSRLAGRQFAEFQSVIAQSNEAFAAFKRDGARARTAGRRSSAPPCSLRLARASVRRAHRDARREEDADERGGGLDGAERKARRWDCAARSAPPGGSPRSFRPALTPSRRTRSSRRGRRRVSGATSTPTRPSEMPRQRRMFRMSHGSLARAAFRSRAAPPRAATRPGR